MLTIYSNRIEFEKLVLKVMFDQIDEFNFNDIFEIVKSNCEVGVSIGFLVEIVDNAFEFCLNEAYIDIYSHKYYVVNLNKRKEFEDIINGTTIIEQSL